MRSQASVVSRRAILRRAALLAALWVGLAACSTPRSTPTPTPPGEPANLLPFRGEPPAWPLTVHETDEIVGAVAKIYFDWSAPFAPVTERCSGLKDSRPEGDLIGGNASVEECLRPYLADQGVGEGALDLFFGSGIAIWSAKQTGPFWLAEGFDYDMYGSNGSPPEYLFTPEGVFDVPGQYTNFSPPEGWGPILHATAAATSTDPMPEIRDAYAEAFGMAAGDIGFWSYGETIDLMPAREVEGGWVVPFSWELLGCHACSTSIYGRFELDASQAGAILGVRYVDACYDPTRVPSDLGAIRERDFGLASCD